MASFSSDRPHLGFAFGLLAVWWVCVILIFRGGWAMDLSAIYMAALFYGEGAYHLVYGAPETLLTSGEILPAWADRLAELGHGDKPTLPYMYPPLWAALLSPVALAMGPQEFSNIVLIAHVGMIAASIPLAYRLLDRQRPRLMIWTAISLLFISLVTPTLCAIILNQPQITVIFLTLLAFERYRAGQIVVAGILIGLAAGLKVTPVIFGLIFLADRNWKALFACLATLIVLALASLLIAGPELHADFLTRLKDVDGILALSAVNYDLGVLLYESAHTLGGTVDWPAPDTPMHIVAEPQWITLTTKLFLVAALAALFWYSRSLRLDRRLWVRLLGLSVIFPITGPLAWSHYFLLTLLLMPGYLSIMPTRWAVFWLVGFGVVFNYWFQVKLMHLDIAFHATIFVAVPALLLGVLVALRAAQRCQ